MISGLSVFQVLSVPVMAAAAGVGLDWYSVLQHHLKAVQCDTKDMPSPS